MKKIRLNVKFLVTAFGGLLAVFFLFFPSHSFAADLVTTEFTNFGETSGLATVELGILIARIIRIMLGVSGIILTCLVFYAGWLYFTSQGDPKATQKAKDIIKTSIIGLLIILSSFAIATFVLNRLLAAAGLGGGVITTPAQNFNEPLSGSLGAGIIESHYPARNATDIPRNTKIYVTFKEPIDIDSIVTGYDEDPLTPDYLNTDNVTIAPTSTEDGSTLTSAEVAVSFTTDQLTFVFDPTPLLGSSTTEMNYTVTFGTGILRASGGSAFDSEGYAWQFEVSTEVDMTPPQVVSIVPDDQTDEIAPNLIVSINFNEAMDPVAASGTYVDSATVGFTNIQVWDGNIVSGTYRVSNSYRTVEFIPADLCGSDPCGNDIFCLPKDRDLEVTAKAASLGLEAPQAELISGLFNGLVDAAGNSLDGDGDETAEGPSVDNYVWEFTTSAEENDDVPKISSVGPTVKETQVDLNRQVEISFDMLMQSSTLNSTNINLVPDFADQTLWFYNLNAENEGTNLTSDGDNFTEVTTEHATFWESDNEGEDSNNNGVEDDLYNYYPVITHGVKSAWQICMSPANGPKEGNADSTVCGSGIGRYCCNGNVAQNTPCTTNNGTSLE